MSKNKSKTVIILFFVIMSILGVFFITFNNEGIIKYFKLRKQLDSLNTQIDSVKQNNVLLQSDIDSLEKKVPAKIEKVAREKYNMIRKGEKEIKIIEK
jgi:cell division protein FtsB